MLRYTIRQSAHYLAAFVLLAGAAFVYALYHAPLTTIAALLATYGIWKLAKKAGLPFFLLYYYLSGALVFLAISVFASVSSHAGQGDSFGEFFEAIMWPFVTVLQFSGLFDEPSDSLKKIAIMLCILGPSVIFSLLHKRYLGKSPDKSAPPPNLWGRQIRS